ncbi:hypothetical protein D3C84_990170 [compost metagenome]
MNRGLVVVDLQNEYLPTGKLPLTDIEHAAANALRVITHARDAGIPIFSKDMPKYCGSCCN